jgi:mannitol 2-dehydrogenase
VRETHRPAFCPTVLSRRIFEHSDCKETRLTLATDATTTPGTRSVVEAALHPSAGVSVPDYDRCALSPGVVHFGVGGFHRAHQAMYLDDLARRGETAWGLVGVGLHSPEMKQVLSAQDHLFTVVTRGAEGEQARIVGVMIDYRYAPQEPAAVLAALTDPRTTLVTLTVTGAGYPVDPATGEFHPDHDDEVAEDLQRPRDPASVFGFIVEALRLRRKAGVAPFTVLSCDNVAGNGRTTRVAVVGFARRRSGDLADWIERSVTFPSSMVDRITPATSPADRDEIAERLGVDDAWPVITEPFSQWIIEDRFCNDRPPLDAVGARFVADVRPYELMKTRLLNGAHCALGYLGLLLGYRCSDEAMGDERVRDFVRAFMDQVIPLLQPVDGIDLQQYRELLIDRFSNRAIGDRLERLAGRGSTKLGSYVVPSIADARLLGADYRLLAVTVAAWIVLLARADGGTPVEDPLREELAPLAARGDVRGLLSRVRGIAWMADDDEVRTAIERGVAAITCDGVAAVLRSAVTA